MTTDDKTVAEADEENDDGGGVPGIVGAAVSVANSKPLQALLGPAFKEIGDLWGEGAKRWADARRAKNAENLDHHRKKVLALDPPKTSEDGPSERQVRDAFEWSKEAASVDPSTDQNLSALWQGILSQILADNDHSDELIRALKTLKRRDADILLRLSYNMNYPKTDEHSHYDKLESLRIIEKSSLLPRGRGGAMLIFVGIIGVGSGILTYTLLSGIPGRDNTSAILGISLAVSSFILAVTPAVMRFGSYRLTDLGRQLQESGRRYLAEATEDSEGLAGTTGTSTADRPKI